MKSRFQRTYVNFSDGLRADIESGCGAERWYSVVAVCGAAAAAAAACAAGGNNSPRSEALLLNIGAPSDGRRRWCARIVHADTHTHAAAAARNMRTTPLVRR